MNKIGIITKHSDPRAMSATRELCAWLVAREVTVTVTEEIACKAEIPHDHARRLPQEQVPEDQELVIVVGGDGTFIAAARALGTRRVPLLGINMGRLGFLTEITSTSMFASLEQILDGHFMVESRTTLEVWVMREGEEVLRHRVLNDVVLHKGHLARMMEFEAFVDGQFVFSSRADGLIVATPTGSTAYALSAGGPIIHPALDAILLVPICPHTLTNRPIAIPGKGVISITLAADHADRLITLDGQTGFLLSDQDSIRIRQSEHPLLVAHAPGRNYYDILRNKLLWGEQVGN